MKARYTILCTSFICLLAAGCANSGRNPDGFIKAADGSFKAADGSQEDFSPETTRRTADPLYNADRVILDDVADPLEIDDPLESLNRAVYSFNAVSLID